MTTLVTEELRTTLTQTFTYDLNKRVSLAGIRPYLTMFNAPAGTFTFTLKRGAVTIATKDFTSTEIKSDLSTSDNYAHLWKVIQFDDPVQLTKGTYSMVISSSGYTYSTSSFLGWNKEFENKFNADDGTATGIFDNPFSYQLFAYQGITE